MDEREELFQRVAALGVVDHGFIDRLQADVGGDLAEAGNANAVRDVLRAVVLARRPPTESDRALVRALIFEQVLDLGLADSELAGILAAAREADPDLELDPDWLRAAIRQRAEDLWPAVASEQSSLEALAARGTAPADVVPPTTWPQRVRERLVRSIRGALGENSRLARWLEGPGSRELPTAATKLAPRTGPPLPEEVDAALRAIEQGLLEKSVLPALRTTVEAELGVLRSTVLPIREARGLGQLADLRTIIPTEGERRLGRLVKTLTTGCIGVAGPRGSGKSTLLEALAEGVLPSTGSPFRYRVRVSAPTRYDSREFLLYLTNVLCGQVLSTLASAAEFLEYQESRRSRLLPLGGAALLFVAGAASILLAITGIDIPRADIPAGVVVGVVAMLAAVVLAFVSWKGVRRPESALGNDEIRIAFMARRLLQETRYQLSFSSSTSTSVSLDLKPLSAEMGASSETSRTRLPQSLPEVVGQFRDFVETISGPDAHTLVCIDELDKMASAEDTEKFLNDVKAIFGISNCVFVLSVSEDALASFERRGLPARDAVDSAVDDVVLLEPLHWAGARQLLAERVPRVPTPFWALCFAQTGGLARDLLRSARALFDEADGEELPLAAATLKLVDTDLRNRTHGTLAALATTSSDVAVDDAATWLHELPGADDLPALQAWVERAPLATLRATEGATRPAQLVAQVVTYGYLAATIREVFAAHRSYEDFEMADAAGSHKRFDYFEEIRRLLAVSPAAGWSAIEKYRLGWTLDPWVTGPGGAGGPHAVGSAVPLPHADPESAPAPHR